MQEKLELSELVPLNEEDELALKEMGVSLAITTDGLMVFAQLEDYIQARDLEKIIKNMGITSPLLLRNIASRNDQKKWIESGEKALLADVTEQLKPVYDLEFKLPTETILKINDHLWRLNVTGEEITADLQLPLINIMKDSVVATRVPESQLEERLKVVDVYGKESKRRKKLIHFKLERNLEQVEHDIIAQLSGRLMVEKDSVRIDERFIIEDLDDWNSGKLRFVGSVDVGQNVIEHFDIEAGQDIVINGSTETASLRAGNEVVVKEGIIGQGEARIQAKQAVRARYVNQAEIFSAHDCEFPSGIHHSVVHAHGKLLAVRGPIVGGFNYGATGVQAKDLGGVSGVRTIVAAGYCREVPLSLDSMIEEAKTEEKRLKTLSDKIRAFCNRPELMEQLTPQEKDQLKNINSQLKQIKKRIQELMLWIDDHDAEACEEARISVTGFIYPGVILKINNMQLEITTEMRKKTFKANYETGEIEIINLKGR